MTQVNADFSQISSNTEPLDEAMYSFRVIELIDQENDEEFKLKNAGLANPKQPAFIVVSEVTEGDRVGAQHQDYLYFKTKEGKPSKMGLGKLKAYAEAIIGKEEANSPNGIDTDRLLEGEFAGYIKIESYQDNSTVPPTQKQSRKLTKVLPKG